MYQSLWFALMFVFFLIHIISILRFVSAFFVWAILITAWNHRIIWFIADRHLWWPKMIDWTKYSMNVLYYCYSLLFYCSNVENVKQRNLTVKFCKQEKYSLIEIVHVYMLNSASYFQMLWRLIKELQSYRCK